MTLFAHRDALIASVLDGVRASGNRDVCVKMMFTSRGYRLGPFTVPVDEEVESQLLKFIQQPPGNDFLSLSVHLSPLSRVKYWYMYDY